MRLIAKMPTLAAIAYKTAIGKEHHLVMTECFCSARANFPESNSRELDAGQPLIYPRNDLSYTENFLHMLFAVWLKAVHTIFSAILASENHASQSFAMKYESWDQSLHLSVKIEFRLCFSGTIREV